MSIAIYCDTCDNEIRADGKHLCEKCRGTLLKSTIIIADKMAKQPQITDETERLIAQRNRLFHIIFSMLSTYSDENEHTDKLFELVEKIVGNTYSEGCNILSEDIDPYPSNPKRAKLYTKVALMVLGETKEG